MYVNGGEDSSQHSQSGRLNRLDAVENILGQYSKWLDQCVSKVKESLPLQHQDNVVEKSIDVEIL